MGAVPLWGPQAHTPKWFVDVVSIFLSWGFLGAFVSGCCSWSLSDVNRFMLIWGHFYVVLLHNSVTLRNAMLICHIAVRLYGG